VEAITQLVADSLARHGLDRPIDPRRLQWSRWFRCDSPHSLLVVPSKPGIFALAEEVAANVPRAPSPTTSAPAGILSGATLGTLGGPILGGAALQCCDSLPQVDAALAAEVKPVRRMLAVLQFSEDDDMAFTLDRMFTRINPMRARLASGRCFLRFVVIQDQDQRRSICSALNQWLVSSAEKATGIPADFQSSLELASVGRTLLSATADIAPTSTTPAPETGFADAPPNFDSGAAKNLHCPHPLPSGF
jgi:hypothetical protein